MVHGVGDFGHGRASESANDAHDAVGAQGEALLVELVVELEDGCGWGFHGAGVVVIGFEVRRLQI